MPRFRFFGYMVAHLTSIYGHRMGVLTMMTMREVRKALGNDETGYLINVSVLIFFPPPPFFSQHRGWLTLFLCLQVMDHCAGIAWHNYTLRPMSVDG